MDESDPPVQRILERAERLSREEAVALDADLRAQLGVGLTARRVLDAHQRFINATAMFYDWADPALEMENARRRVAVALGLPLRPWHAFEPDDGTVAWGAATAAAFAVLGSGRASSLGELRAAWEGVIDHCQPPEP
jgi:hypothetical protein